uniref:DUF223 domain-containing protein n=1 Tax=Lactuca sativa TaxID=4236 RepID=A0A9R1VHF1_LACSA|nr:hypothetical protein LSAT_V11C500292190 [Lactuca sativa]
MENNSAGQLVFDKLVEIDASKESWNIHVKVVLIWKQTYKTNPKMVGSLDMILINQQYTLTELSLLPTGHSNIGNNKKNLIHVFEALFDEEAVKEIINEGYCMFVPHKHEINFYKTTLVHVSTEFVDMVDPYHCVSFPDLLANNFDTSVAFSIYPYFYTSLFNVTHLYHILIDYISHIDFRGQVISTDPMRVIVKNGREKKSINLLLCGTIFALKLNTYILEHQNENVSVIILLRLTKLKYWGDYRFNFKVSLKLVTICLGLDCI